METLAPPVRKRRVGWYPLVVAAAAVAVFSGVFLVLSMHTTSSRHVTVNLVPGCRNPSNLHIAGRVWVAAAPAPANWPDAVPGTFRITSAHKAAFTADAGGL